MVFCHKWLQLKLQQEPRWKRFVMRQFWHNIFEKMLQRRGRRNLKETLGNFELEYLAGDGIDYDFGINYWQCGHQKFLKEQGAEDFLPYVCLADITLSDAYGWGLKRTQTLGDGCQYCDFRFKKGANTKITAKTLEIQALLDKM